MLKTMRETMTVPDRIIAFGVMTGLAIVLVQYARMLALPAHFV
ncbi:hypothetical protein [Methylobacterium nonmethylotrophicum]|nr:hypothetical protein [Methylobacterium nonmethylotrophicum]